MGDEETGGIHQDTGDSKKKSPIPFQGSDSWLVAKYPDDFVARDLDEIAAAKGLHQRRHLVHQRAKIRGLDFPALGQLADDELGVGVDQQAVLRRRLACPLDAASQILQSSDEGLVLGFVVGHAVAETEPDCLLLASSRLQAVGSISDAVGRSIGQATAIDDGQVRMLEHGAPPNGIG